MSSSTHTTNGANNILVLGKDFIEGISMATIYTKKFVQSILVQLEEDFVQTYAIMETVVIYLLMVEK